MATAAGPAVYVVLDLLGAGRVLGVFDDAERARRVANIAPHYYKVHETTLNRLDPDARRWAVSDEQRAALDRALLGADD